MSRRKPIPEHDHSEELKKIDPHRWMGILLELLAEQKGVEITDVVITTATERRAMEQAQSGTAAGDCVSA